MVYAFLKKLILQPGKKMKASYPEQEPNVEALIVDNMNTQEDSLAYAWHTTLHTQKLKI